MIKLYKIRLLLSILLVSNAGICEEEVVLKQLSESGLSEYQDLYRGLDQDRKEFFHIYFDYISQNDASDLLHTLGLALCAEPYKIINEVDTTEKLSKLLLQCIRDYPESEASLRQNNIDLLRQLQSKFSPTLKKGLDNNFDQIYDEAKHLKFSDDDALIYKVNELIFTHAIAVDSKIKDRQPILDALGLSAQEFSELTENKDDDVKPVSSMFSVDYWEELKLLDSRTYTKLHKKSLLIDKAYQQPKILYYFELDYYIFLRYLVQIADNNKLTQFKIVSSLDEKVFGAIVAVNKISNSSFDIYSVYSAPDYNHSNAGYFRISRSLNHDSLKGDLTSEESENPLLLSWDGMQELSPLCRNQILEVNFNQFIDGYWSTDDIQISRDDNKIPYMNLIVKNDSKTRSI